MESMAWGKIGFVRDASVPSNETWSGEIVETPTQKDPKAFLDPLADLSEGIPPGAPKGFFGASRLPYADDLDAVRVRIVRTIRHRRSERIALPEGRLVVRPSGSMLVWKDLTIPNDLGLKMVLRPRPPARNDAVPPKGFPISPYISLSADLKVELKAGLAAKRSDFDLLKMSFAPEGDRSSKIVTSVYSTGTTTTTHPAFLQGQVSLSTEDKPYLNAVSLSIPKSSPAARGAPFVLKGTIVQAWDEIVETFEATVPVEPLPRT